MNAEFDSNWVARFNEGDARAFKQLYTHFYDPLFYFTNKIIGNSAEAEDIVLETFMKLFKRSADFDSYVNVRAFLYIAARNASFNVLKAAEVQSNRAREISMMQENAAQDALRLDNEMMEGEVLQQIYKAVEELPEVCKKVFKLLYYEGLKHSEVALKLGISVNTVRNHRSRAIQLLRTHVAQKHQALVLWILASGLLQYLHRNNSIN